HEGRAHPQRGLYPERRWGTSGAGITHLLKTTVAVATTSEYAEFVPEAIVFQWFLMLDRSRACLPLAALLLFVAASACAADEKRDALWAAVRAGDVKAVAAVLDK